MTDKGPSVWTNLPIRVVGSALVALDRADRLRTRLVDSIVPAPLADKLKDPIPDLGDTLFNLARYELEQINALYTFWQRMVRRCTGGAAPAEGAKPTASAPSARPPERKS